MSYEIAQPGPKLRPGSVNAARLLLYVGAALAVANGVLGLIANNAARGVTLDQEGVPPEVANLSGTIGMVVGVVVFGVLAIGLAVLANLVGRGMNPARIVTWVVDGLVVVCCGCGLAGDAVSSAFLQNTGISQEQLDQIAAATPGWVTVATIVASIAMILSQAAVIILLALPPSNDFFRREQEVWVPPTDAGGAVPPYPPTTPYPGGSPPGTPPAPPAPPGFSAPPPGSPPAPPGSPPQPPGPDSP